MEQNWEQESACRNTDPDVFFSQRTVGLAKQTCKDCPVRLECLEATLAAEADVPKTLRIGIVAALTGAQRWELTKQRRRAAGTPVKERGPGRPKAPCGTESAYQRHSSKGEPIDQACRDAHSATERAKYRKRTAAKALTPR
ncbi:WhiB family transcriptional regulator [Streptomyces griseoluteus]|uniref:WhiB family transcriptional regulator n=1 Tax=Streptomyces griseoluteus TaxID=29306 RepID=UPI00342A246E